MEGVKLVGIKDKTIPVNELKDGQIAIITMWKDSSHHENKTVQR